MQLQKNNAENQQDTFTNIKENTNTSLELSATAQNLNNIVHLQPMETNHKEATETDFNSTLVDDQTIFSSDTVKTFSLIVYETSYKNNFHKNNININNNKKIKTIIRVIIVIRIKKR